MSKFFLSIFVITIMSIHSQTIINLGNSFPMSSIPISNPFIQPNGTSDNSTEIQIIKSSNKGISTGAICAIAIPCVALLLGAALAAFLLKGSVAAAPMAMSQSFPPPNYIDTSGTQLNVPQHQIQTTTTPQIVQAQPVQVQPVQVQIQQPNYPVHQLEPPVVNNAFKPMYPNTQVQMIPIQQVEMVPITKVEMVPVKEVVPIQNVQTGPIQQVSQQIQQVVQQPPKVGQDGELVTSTNLMVGKP